MRLIAALIAGAGLAGQVSHEARAFQDPETTRSICNQARQYNRSSISFWKQDLQSAIYRELLKEGHSISIVAGYLAYLKEEMRRQCPDVW